MNRRDFFKVPAAAAIGVAVAKLDTNHAIPVQTTGYARIPPSEKQTITISGNSIYPNVLMSSTAYSSSNGITWVS